jgi:hypothetical protein
MDEIWMRMASRYGHAWVSQYGAEPDGIAAAEWRDTLAGLTAAQIREGFDADRSRGEQWPPSSTQFRAMCLGIPSLAAIRDEIRQLSDPYGNPHVSRFARGVWSRISAYNYRNGTGKQQDGMLRDAFELTRTFVMEGGTLPVDPVGYIAPAAKEPHKPAPPEVAKSHLDKIAELLKTDPVKPHAEVDDGDAA